MNDRPRGRRTAPLRPRLRHGTRRCLAQTVRLLRAVTRCRETAVMTLMLILTLPVTTVSGANGIIRWR